MVLIKLYLFKDICVIYTKYNYVVGLLVRSGPGRIISLEICTSCMMYSVVTSELNFLRRVLKIVNSTLF